MSDLEQIHIVRWGAGEPVVMVHGGVRGGPVGGADTFAAQRPLADDGYELVLPDRPGHGLSPPGDGRDDLEVDAIWLRELLGSGAHLVGHSYGAAIALCAAAARPETTRSLTLIEAPIFSAARDDPRAVELAREMEAVYNEPDELRTILGFARVVGIPAGILGPRADPGQLMVMARSLKTMRDPITWEAGPTLDAVAAAGIPVMVVTGGWSPGFEAIGDALASHLAAERVVIDAGHHLPHLTRGVDGDPDGAHFNAVLRELLLTAGRRRTESAETASNYFLRRK